MSSKVEDGDELIIKDVNDVEEVSAARDDDGYPKIAAATKNQNLVDADSGRGILTMTMMDDYMDRNVD